ncbi:MAG TPA: LysM peptidoglycan-binding domain-containing protein [Verrucomicrobiae bacterium]|nr:LysM peptidoglycan-binding domain-containing protein [Verrucomicrobiae bacterium]
MNSPSPLVPQGAIPPKTTSRPQRVLMIAAMVVGLHVAGLSLVLFQGCGKDGAGTQTAGNTETNSTAGLSYPTDTNSAPMFASASNAPAANMAATPTNGYVPPAPTGAFGATPNPNASNVAGGTPDQGTPVPLTSDQPVLTGNEKDYRIAKGDNLTSIASRNGVTLSAIMKINPNLDPKKLKVGQSIKIPQPAPAAAANVAAAGTGSTPPTTRNAATGAAAGLATGTYKVKAGDTLTKIARTHGITVNELRAANNMKTTQVQVGKVLKIPARTQRTAAAPTNSTTH